MQGTNAHFVDLYMEIKYAVFAFPKFIVHTASYNKFIVNWCFSTYFRIYDMRDTFCPLQSLQGLKQHSPGCGLAATARANHHEAVVQLGDLEQL